MTPDEVLDALQTRRSGLDALEVSERTQTYGPNAVRSHHASAWSVLARQLRSPLLWLLLAAAAVSAVVGEGLDAVIIGLIVAGSVGLGFVNEFRAERAAEAMHSEIRHEVAATRDGEPVSVEVTHLVPGDIVHLGVGTIVPADLRLLTADNLECDESILTGESVAAEKSPERGGDRRAARRVVVVPVHGNDRARGQRQRRGDCDGGRHSVRADRGRPRGTPPPDRVPTRPDPILRPVGQGRRRAQRHDLRDQRRAGPSRHRRRPVLACRRGRHHPPIAAGRGLDQPGDGLSSTRREEGARQAAGVHRGSR